MSAYDDLLTVLRSEGAPQNAIGLGEAAPHLTLEEQGQFTFALAMCGLGIPAVTESAQKVLAELIVRAEINRLSASMTPER
jgi:hypothetical protein